ncbi:MULTISPECIES: YveK family protein [Loigolactobacillus]|uniref:Uncharacterized protein n=1 Tax=Loigolactobacillus backii TaxID=375175 RepID=A0A192H017_9LACO|nr:MULTISPECIES: hypothetical protein [Loigolactobacillus]ANK61311.1 hypothetical protein AYR53_00180 [Loigolactobacillus backii]ANK69489.1 hypothetical protein AYR56_04535 [Loigolactobacillus backii]MDA5388142.1 hypothetical protein [Loigolactobacillus backii]MDA5390640.1 hypothetical protein [Loigolactobacillus backii]
MQKKVYHLNTALMALFNWKVMLLAIIGGLIGAYAFNYQAANKPTATSYTGTTFVLLSAKTNKQPTTQAGLDQWVPDESTVKTYTYIMHSGRFMATASQALAKQGIKMNSVQLQNSVGTWQNSNTNLISVQAKGNRKNVTTIADSVAETAVAQYGNYLSKGKASLIQSAWLETNTTKPKTLGATFQGGLLGFLLVCLIAVLFSLLRKGINAKFLQDHLGHRNVFDVTKFETPQLASEFLMTIGDKKTVLLTAADETISGQWLAKQVAKLGCQTLFISFSADQEADRKLKPISENFASITIPASDQGYKMAQETEKILEQASKYDQIFIQSNSILTNPATQALVKQVDGIFELVSPTTKRETLEEQDAFLRKYQLKFIGDILLDTKA